MKQYTRLGKVLIVVLVFAFFVMVSMILADTSDNIKNEEAQTKIDAYEEVEKEETHGVYIGQMRVMNEGSNPFKPYPADTIEILDIKCEYVQFMWGDYKTSWEISILHHASTELK